MWGSRFRGIRGVIFKLLAITVISFLLMQLAPGDPTQMYIDPSMSAADIAQVKENLGLNASIPVQYFKWLGSTLKGDLGYSYMTGQPVLDVLKDRLPATLILSISSLLLILILTFPLGIITAARRDEWPDYLITTLSFIGMAMPTFWVGLMFILFFSLKLNLLPTSGMIDPSLINASLFKQNLSIAAHLVLPLLTISVGGLAGLIRYNRAGMIAILNQDYIKAARARGVGQFRLLAKHVFKNAALPIITILGLSLPGLIGGSYVIEYIFAWPGMGQLGITAVFARDYPVLMATILFSGILVILGNTLADWAYKKVDPRIS